MQTSAVPSQLHCLIQTTHVCPAVRCELQQPVMCAQHRLKHSTCTAQISAHYEVDHTRCHVLQVVSGVPAAITSSVQCYQTILLLQLIRACDICRSSSVVRLYSQDCSSPMTSLSTCTGACDLQFSLDACALWVKAGRQPM